MPQPNTNVMTSPPYTDVMSSVSSPINKYKCIISPLTISVLQACCAVTTEYGIPGDFVKTSTASLQIKISTAQVNFSNRKVIIF